MADDRSTGDPAMHRWDDAFAALPLEPAPRDGWLRMQAALQAEPQPRSMRLRRAWPLAAAAALAAVVLPFVLTRAPAPPTAATAHVAMPATSVPRQPPAVVDDTTPVTTAPLLAVKDASAVPRRLGSPGIDSGLGPRREKTPRKARVPRAVAAATVSAPSPHASLDASGDDGRTLQALYAESAQLETLLQLTRDDRLASATDAVLTGEANARVELIDAALSQDGLAAVQRTQLWRDRVGALRDAVGVASTSRWLATRGEHIEDALVRVD